MTLTSMKSEETKARLAWTSRAAARAEVLAGDAALGYRLDASPSRVLGAEWSLCDVEGRGVSGYEIMTQREAKKR